jgi:hypothetical protein
MNGKELSDLINQKSAEGRNYLCSELARVKEGDIDLGYVGRTSAKIAGGIAVAYLGASLSLQLAVREAMPDVYAIGEAQAFINEAKEYFKTPEGAKEMSEFFEYVGKTVTTGEIFTKEPIELIKPMLGNSYAHLLGFKIFLDMKVLETKSAILACTSLGGFIGGLGYTALYSEGKKLAGKFFGSAPMSE